MVSVFFTFLLVFLTHYSYSAQVFRFFQQKTLFMQKCTVISVLIVFLAYVFLTTLFVNFYKFFYIILTVYFTVIGLYCYYLLRVYETDSLYTIIFISFKNFVVSLLQQVSIMFFLPIQMWKLINKFGWVMLFKNNINMYLAYPDEFNSHNWAKKSLSFLRIPLFFKYSVFTNEANRLYITHSVVVYNFFKTTIVALVFTIVYFIYMIFFFKIQFLKQLSVWFIIGMMAFWLFSGFNFFLKRYQYGKFTSQIQRFWKRTNTCFWLIEGFLILLFFYYYLNSSQEPVYMYDYSSLNQEYLVSLQTIGFNIILLSLIIYFMYFVLLRINSNTWSQLNLYIIVISIFIFFSFFIETYQFFYVLSTFNERLWVFNEEENLWSLEIDNPILRTKQQYLLVCLIAKYWHFLFIFLSWVFFLMKSFERRKITYPLFSVNLQNFIILYALNFVCYAQWFKWVYRRFFDLPYTWFMTNNDTKFFFRLFSEIQLFVVNMSSFSCNLIIWQQLVFKSLLTWETNSLVLWKFI